MTLDARLTYLGRTLITVVLVLVTLNTSEALNAPVPHELGLLVHWCVPALLLWIGVRCWNLADDLKACTELLVENLGDAQEQFRYFKQGLIDFANRTAEPPDTKEAPGRWILDGWQAGEGTVENHRLARRNAETVSPGEVECVLQDAAGMTIGRINAAYYFATCDDSVIDQLAADDWSDGDIEEDILLTMMRVDPKVDLLVTGRRMSDDPRYDDTLTLTVNRHVALLWLTTYRSDFHFKYCGKKLRYRQNNPGPNWSPDDNGAYWIDDEQNRQPDEDGYPADAANTPLAMGAFVSDGPLPPKRRTV